METQKSSSQLLAWQIAKGLAVFVVVIILLYSIKHYLGERYEEFLQPVMGRPLLMYSIFLFSETIIGIIPPEFFMDWLMQSEWWPFFQQITFLGLISYLGGITAFAAGKLFSKSQMIRQISRTPAYRKYQAKYEEYGGVLILISAVSPLPFAMISTISGSMGYSWKNYFRFAIFRMARFWVYGYLMWQAAQVL